MALDAAKLIEITQRGDAISKRSKIALMEFDVAVEANDTAKQEEIRVKMHQLIDDQLDLQLEVKHIKDAHTKEILERMKRDFK